MDGRLQGFLRLITLCSLLALAAGAPPAQAQEWLPKTWILFRPDTTHLAAALPLPEETATRRRLRGAPTAQTDRPVPPAYVDALRALGVEVLVESHWLHAVSARLTEAQRRQVAALPFVAALRPVARFQTVHAAAIRSDAASVLEAPRPTGAADTSYRQQLRAINALAPLERGIDGRGVRLGFLDTRYNDFAHVVFDPLLADDRLLADSNFVGRDQSNLHGQFVASVAVGGVDSLLVGPGRGATVIAATTEYAPTETTAEEDHFVAALEWMERELSVDVVNVSLGYTTFDRGQDSYTVEDLDGETALTTRAADAAAERGVVVVAAAGNQGCFSPTACWFYVSTPADGDDVIAVGAVDTTGIRASFSGAGPTADGRIKPDVVAPGVGVAFAVGTTGLASGNGTSFATPLVSGVVTQMLQVNPSLTPRDVRALLRQTARQAVAPDTLVGWGLIDAGAAVQAAAEALTSRPDTPGPSSPLVATVAPQPARDAVTLHLELPTAADARWMLYDVLGRRVQAQPLGRRPAGLSRARLTVAALPAGVYLYRVEAGVVQATGTLVVR